MHLHFGSCKIFVLPLFLISFYGCEGSFETGPATPELANEITESRGAANINRPFKATLLVIVAPNNFVAPGQPGSEERCNQAGMLTGKFSGEGEATHLGQLTFEAVDCSEPPVPGPANFNLGEGAFIAVNGRDIITFIFSGMQDALDENFIANTTFDIVITGGEGRFKNATGEATASGIVNFATGTFEIDTEGFISFASSNIAELNFEE